MVRAASSACADSGAGGAGVGASHVLCGIDRGAERVCASSRASVCSAARTVASRVPAAADTLGALEQLVRAIMDTMEVENGAPDAEGGRARAPAEGEGGFGRDFEPKKEIYAAAVAMDVDGGGEAEAADEELPVAAGEAVPPDEAPAEEAASTADAARRPPVGGGRRRAARRRV